LARITVNGSENSNEIFIRASALLLAKRDAGRFLPAGRNQQRRRDLSGRSGVQQRRATKVGDWLDMAKTLAAAASRWCSPRSRWCRPRPLGELKRYVENGDFLLEASDLAW
jgi:hypothetical protein